MTKGNGHARTTPSASLVKALTLAAVVGVLAGAPAATAVAETPAEFIYRVSHSVFGDIGTYSNTIEPSRVETLLAQIVREAQPGSGDLRHRGHSQRRQILQAEPRTTKSAHQKKRITCRNLTEADQGRVRVHVAGLHDPHRSAPGEIDRAVKERRCGCGRGGRVDELDRDTLVRIKSQCVSGVEWCVKHRAKVFSELDSHGGRSGREFSRQRARAA